MPTTATAAACLRRNGGCWFLNTSTCLVGWPNLPTEPEVRRYYQLELAWYLHMLLKPVLRYGLPDGRDMLIHHAASLTLIVISYVTNLTRLGTVVLGTFAMSNPLLHLAKICNQLSLGPLKIGGFMIFALIFFLSRILLVPWAVLKVTWLDCRHEVPYAVEDFWAIHLVYSLLLTLLYAMQLLWMRGILRVLRSALQHGSDAASHMSARIDPAKRYKVGADPGAPPVRGAAAAQHGGSNGAANGALPRTPSPPDPPTLPKGSNGGEGATGRKNR
ncbi:hypothetical protein CHLNCDRAFT_52373 [Chlorella variabilis]|uniref:TLC domain-containing protein n=1 Tax=Chlorella variabilis TaxID=554065 RepID=E1ZET7_CHLVA|nr:hypothetical protein CHLNCDRAFT_52373 [Chlorella variabilis]EFN55716.1 hypothetical protein CHLNCDRAFT_52373 [Chlorella variabilis]|eukprot:XP_005847818.1 hypothetical protein CHLNCDRAFT_52373 [Chlorella variabilis]